MLPIPAAFVEELQLLLRRMSAVGAGQILQFLGFSVFRENTTLYLPHAALVIAEACSGFATLYATLVGAVLLAYRIPSRRALLLLAAGPCAVACNVIRVALLAMVVNARGLDVLDTSLHPISGVLSFAAGMMVLLGLAGRAPKAGA
jgi:exosortase